MLEYSCDIAIIGSGFGGSMMAMICRRLGLEVVLLERGKHPRFAIGESTSPLMNLLIEQLSDQYDLPNMKPLAAYGTWMEQCPQVMRGLKRGFTYYSHEAGKAFVNASDRSDQLLVAASPNNRLADTHWLRADVDAFLTTEAEGVGVVHLQGVKLVAFRRSNDTNHLTGTHEGEGIAVASKLIIDASGVGGFLS